MPLSTDAAPLAYRRSDERADSPSRTAAAPERLFLSTIPAGAADRRLALAFVAVSAVIFASLAPFAKTPLTPVPAFIPLYQSALIISDLLTAVLLFNQYHILRSKALLPLASAYLFTAFITVSHTLSFPGLFAPGGALGSGPQTTAWLYMFWHGGFPLLVVAYAAMKGSAPEKRPPGAMIALAAALVLGAVCAATSLTTWGHGLLPAVMAGSHYTPALIFVVSTVWSLSMLALFVLWVRRPHTVLDVWLMVVMCAWLFDVALSAVLNAGRYDLGFYSGRLYGFVAATFVLVVLLLENSTLGVRMFGARNTVETTLPRFAGTPRLTYGVTGLLLLVLVAISAHTYFSVRGELTDAVTKRRLALAQVAAVTQSERLDRVVDIAVSLATRVRFADLVAAGEWNAAIQILRGVPAEFSFIDRLAVFDPDGTLRADTALERVSGRNFADRDWYLGLQRTDGRPYVSSMYRRAAPPQIDVFAIAAPIVGRDGRQAGILLLHVNIDAFFSWARELDFGDSAGVVVVDREGNEAFRSAAPKREAIVNLSSHPVVARLVGGGSGVEIATDPADGVEKLYAFVPARHGWGVLTEQSAAVAFATRDSQLVRVTVGSALVLLLFASTLMLAMRVVADRRRRERRLMERLKVLSEIDHAMIAEKPTEAIAAAVIQPLRQLLGVSRAIVNRFDLAAGEVEWVAAAGRRRIHVGPGVRYPMRMMGDVEALKRGETQIVDTRKLPQGSETEALLASGVNVYMVVPMIAGGELLGALSFGSDTDSFPPEQVSIAREVATQLAIAMAQARLLERVKQHATELESRVLERTAELEAVNKELSSFSYSVSHDLRAPLRAVDGYARMLEEDYAARLDEEGKRLLTVIRSSAGRMGQLIDDLLDFSRLGRQQMTRKPVDIDALVREVIGEVRGNHPASIEVQELAPAHGDRALLKQVWVNLIGNALKYSAKRDAARVEIGSQVDGEENVYWVRDNGAGFDMRYAAKLFGVFQRLHAQDEFAGTGVGLAIVQRVVMRHGGRVWAEGQPDAGARFSFSLPRES